MRCCTYVLYGRHSATTNLHYPSFFHGLTLSRQEYPILFISFFYSPFSNILKIIVSFLFLIIRTLELDIPSKRINLQILRIILILLISNKSSVCYYWIIGLNLIFWFYGSISFEEIILWMEIDKMLGLFGKNDYAITIRKLKLQFPRRLRVFIFPSISFRVPTFIIPYSQVGTTLFRH